MNIRRPHPRHKYHYGLILLLPILFIFYTFWPSPKKSHRIAILLPYVGHAPAFLDVFCFGAAGAADIADFLIIGSLKDHPGCPPNVKFHTLSTQQLATLLARVVRKDTLAFDRSRFLHVIQHNIEIYPYALVEFKPAYGYVFGDYIKGYSHWGYADLDMVFGDLSRWLTPDELDIYDVVTYGFGDQHHLYLRGQFTIHKNNEKINSLWQDCEYLSKLDTRYKQVMEKEEEYKFESAEGCYSSVVLQRNDISIKYAAKAWTDVEKDDPVYTHGVYFARHGKRHVLYKSREKEALHLTSSWFENDAVYRDRYKELQIPAGEMRTIALPDDEDSKCMYWVQQKYQRHLCLDEDEVGPSDTVAWIQGELFAQPHQVVDLPSNVKTAPFFHFQEWKRYYRPSQVSSLQSSSKVSGFVLSKEGAIPLFPKGLLSHGKDKAPSPLGSRKWKSSQKEVRKQLPMTDYCLISGPRKTPPKPPAADCYTSISWQDHDRVHILSSAPGWNNLYEQQVTLILTLQLSSKQVQTRKRTVEALSVLDANLAHSNDAPTIALVHAPSSSSEIIELLSKRYGPKTNHFDLNLNNVFLAVVTQEGDLSRRALANMAIDLVPTRWFLHGLELERGLVISKQAMLLAVHEVNNIDSTRGNVFILPQFASEHQSLDIDVKQIIALQRASALRDPASFEGRCEEEYDQNAPNFLDRWWVQTMAMMSLDKFDEEATENEAADLEKLQVEFTLMMAHQQLDALFAYDESPILLVDNKGPFRGMRTHESVRHLEELGGMRCYNSLFLSQLLMLGYNLQILGGAFAVSNEASRAAFVHEDDDSLNRCDGCFMFPHKHESIVEAIVADERHLVAKAAILWHELQHP